MKKIHLLILLLLGVFFSVNAQKNSPIKEVKGSEYKPEKTNRTSTFTNAVKYGDYYYVMGKKFDIEYANLFIYAIPKLKNTDFLIYKLDAKMNVKGVYIVPSEFSQKNVNSLSLRRFGDNLCAFFYFNNKKQLKQYLFAQMIDIKSFKSIGKPYKIAETAITKKEKKISSIFQYSITSDYQKLLVTADKTNVWQSRRERKAAASQKNHTFSYWLIDKDFKLLNIGKNIKLGKGNTNVIGQTFDNEGNMCFLGFEEATSNKKKSKKLFGDIDGDEESNTSKLVMKIIKPSGESNDLTFANGEYFYSATLKLNPTTGNVAVIGLLGSGRYGAKGIFTQQVNLASGEVLAENKELFGIEMVKEINALKPPAKSSKDKSSRKNEKEKPSKKPKKAAKVVLLDYIHMFVNLGAVHYNDSNELIVVGQKHYTYTVTYTTTNSKGQTTTRTVTYYVYGDIISFKLNAEGKIENFGYVFHHYETTVPIDKDYSSLYANEKLFLITKTGGCQVKLNNTASAMTPFKESEYKRRKYIYADFLNVTDNELVHILLSRRKVVFSLMSVKLED